MKKANLAAWAMIAIATASASSVHAYEPSLAGGTVLEAAQRLKPGEFLWAPQVAPEGPLLIVISLATQRAVVYRNGVPIGITTVSTGKPGHSTPTGIFTILQKHVEHYSNLYDNAPMPYMQRLTWGGIALHGGHLPGYPASHGCVRLPHEFARLLFGVTRVGMTVVEILADDGRVAERHPIVDEDRDAANRAQLRELVVPHERDDGVDLVGDAFEIEDDEDLADVRRDVAADDTDRCRHGGPF